MIKKLFALPTISYGITVCNEVNELTHLLQTLMPLIDAEDEILILQDITVENQEVSNLIAQYSTVKHIQAQLNGDFANFKNNLIKQASKKYLFQIDADEYPQITLIKKLKWFLFTRWFADAILVPRINTVAGITEADVQKWNWKINADNYINFPDYQPRIFKLNGQITWKNKVHEVLTNFKKRKKLPKNNYDYCLHHPKEIKRQRAQNSFYDTL
ncbi:hypothetical protein ACL9RF_15375 [Sphingobacterium sp. Mn56C]|uniref:hypothetical protein n=1 Tax=Sphingobacterium sp. Mn56C TaxID=3395261 RepID=UPI003BDF7A2E